MRFGKIAITITSLIVMLMLSTLAVCAEELNTTESSAEDELVGVRFESFDDAAVYLRNQMMQRKDNIVISGPFDMNSLLKLMDAALADDGGLPANGGDYLAANILATSIGGGGGYYAFKIDYADDAEKEAEVTAAIPGIINSFNLSSSASDYEKVKAIHDYLANHIEYTNVDDYNCHSTYAALIKGKCVCQGYTSAFVRLAKTMGLQARMITGKGNGGNHAWNIVKVDGKWYYIDCTFDDQGGPVYNFFLKCPSHFPSHKAEEKFQTAEFLNAYPMSETCYSSENGCGAKPSGINQNNIPYEIYTAIDETTVTTAVTTKPKLLVFYATNNSNSQNTLKSISQSEWVKSGKIEVIALKTNETGTERQEKAIVEKFRSTFCNNTNDIKFIYKDIVSASDQMWDYALQNGKQPDDINISLPVIVLIDDINMVQYYGESFISAESLERDVLAKYLGGWGPVSSSNGSGNGNNSTGGNNGGSTGISAPFSDVKANAWYTDSIQYVYSRGIMNGYSNSNKFGVNDNLTREQFATMLYRMQGEPGITFSGRFSDVRPGQYYSNAIEWCAANGIVTGYTNSSRFGVGDKIQRQQLAAMIYRYAKYVGKNVSDSASVDSFPDRNQIDSYATDPLKWCVGKGILTGKNKGGVYYLDPKGKATRAECATMITRFMTK